MSASDDYPTMANGGFDDAEIGAMLNEIDRLRDYTQRLRAELAQGTLDFAPVVVFEPEAMA